MGLADIARCGIGCHLTHGTRIHNALDDAAGTICSALYLGLSSAIFAQLYDAFIPEGIPNRPAAFVLLVAVRLRKHACHVIIFHRVLNPRFLSLMAAYMTWHGCIIA